MKSNDSAAALTFTTIPQTVCAVRVRARCTGARKASVMRKELVFPITYKNG